MAFVFLMQNEYLCLSASAWSEIPVGFCRYSHTTKCYLFDCHFIAHIPSSYCMMYAKFPTTLEYELSWWTTVLLRMPETSIFSILRYLQYAVLSLHELFILWHYRVNSSASSENTYYMLRRILVCGLLCHIVAVFWCVQKLTSSHLNESLTS